MNYIDQNPVVVGLAPTPADWKASGAYYKALNIQGLVDFVPHKPDIKLLSPIPPIISRLIPPAQLSCILRKPIAYLRYYTDTADYFIYEYDGENTMYGKVRFNVFPTSTVNQKICLSTLLSNQSIKLDYSWGSCTLAH
jgi:hypothetical protein